MKKSIKRQVYEKNGITLCDVPDAILQFPKNITAYAYADNATVKSVKFAVIKRPAPDGYVDIDRAEILILDGGSAAGFGAS